MPNWVKKCFTITNGNGMSGEGQYFTAISPLEFYEWKFRQSIPKGSRFTKLMPRSDIFTEGKIIARASIPHALLTKKDNIFELTDEVKSVVDLTAGEISSPSEIFIKFQNMKTDFSRLLYSFRRGLESQKYFTSTGDNPKLYRIKQSDAQEVELQCFGAVKEVKEHLVSALNTIKKSAYNKKGRAYEMENYTRFDNYMLMLKNSAIPIDAVKMEYLINIANIDPQKTYKISWDKCFIEVSVDAKLMDQQIKMFETMNWIKQALNYSNKNKK